MLAMLWWKKYGDLYEEVKDMLPTFLCLDRWDIAREELLYVERCVGSMT